MRVLKTPPIVGVVALGLGLAAVWVLDLIERRARSLDEIATAARPTAARPTATRRVALAQTVLLRPNRRPL